MIVYPSNSWVNATKPPSEALASAMIGGDSNSFTGVRFPLPKSIHSAIARF